MLSGEIIVNRNDYNIWRLGTIVFGILFLFMFCKFAYDNYYNKYSNADGYFEGYIMDKEKGLCVMRFDSSCKPVPEICQSDIDLVNESRRIIK